jgi:hypothetical protein
MAHCYADNITRPFWLKGMAKGAEKNMSDEIERKLQAAHASRRVLLGIVPVFVQTPPTTLRASASATRFPF